MVGRVKVINLDMQKAGEKRVLDLYELEELHLEAYKNVKHILRREFHVGEWVLLFNSRFCLFLGKHKSKWNGLFLV
jgi:hypothetical protein